MSHPFPRALNRSPTPSLRAVVGKIVQTEGPRGFFRGLTPSLIRAFPANACAIGVYEGAMRAFNAEEVSAGPGTGVRREDDKTILDTSLTRQDYYLLHLSTANYKD